MNPSHPAKVSGSDLQECRTAFYAWVRDQGCDTDGAWSAWQGCWNLLHPDADVPHPRKPLNGIQATLRHGEGAYAQCGYCGRYSLDPNTLSDDMHQPACECGLKHYWSGSFVKPGPDAQWSGRAPGAACEAVPPEGLHLTARSNEEDVLSAVQIKEPAGSAIGGVLASENDSPKGGA